MGSSISSSRTSTSSAVCASINTVCFCLSCGKGKYLVRFVHTFLCIAIPVSLIVNRRSDLHHWLVTRDGWYICGILYCGAILISLIFYFAACFTDPGYVSQQILNALDAAGEEEEVLFSQPDNSYTLLTGASNSNSPNRQAQHASSDYELINKAYDPSDGQSSTAVFNDIDLQTNDEIDVHPDTTSSTDLLPKSTRQTEHRVCKVCNIEQPLRSRHCDDCKRCVLKFDHHCPWLSACVGEKNHRFFWLFLLFINLVIVWSAIIAVRAFPQASDSSSSGQSDTWNTLFVIVDMIVLAVGGVSTVCLFGFHSYLMVTNQTTWESVSRSKISYLKNIREDFNPFHMGYCRNGVNFCCACTPKKWLNVYSKTTSTINLDEL